MTIRSLSLILQIEKYHDHNGKPRKKCLVECDKCHKKGWRNDYYAVKNKEKHICRDCNNKIQGALKLGKPSPFKGKKRKKDSEYIVGSTYVNSSGYVEEYVGRHTYKDKRGGYYLQHRKVVEKDIGRRLNKNEKIHHIDGNKQNNNRENLLICESMSEHRNVHNTLEKAAFEAVKKGIIKFDKNKKEYYIG